MVATVVSERQALKRWFMRYWGAGSSMYKAKLEKDPDFTYCSPNMLGKFRAARTRIARLWRHGTTAAAQGAPLSLFMNWWRGCDRDGFAAWHPDVVGGIRGGSAPRAAYNWWKSRYYHAAGTAPVETLAQAGREAELRRREMLMVAAQATPVAPHQVVAPVSSTVPNLAPTGFVAPTSTAQQPVNDSGMVLAMRGLGSTWAETVGKIAAETVAPVPVRVSCPATSIRNMLFGFTTAPVMPAPLPTTPRPTPPTLTQVRRILPVEQAVAEARARAAAEADYRRRLEQLQEQIAGLQAQLSAAASAGASSQISGLQAQVAELTAAMTAAQGEHAAAAQAAAAAHRDEVASLQAQIDALTAAMATSTDNTEVAGLRAQVEALLGQLAAAEVAADEATEAAADSEAAYDAATSWFERNKKSLLIGGGVLAAGLIGWRLWSGRKAMRLPAPTSPASPSGL
jgi:hypothetical protein